MLASTSAHGGKSAERVILLKRLLSLTLDWKYSIILRINSSRSSRIDLNTLEVDHQGCSGLARTA